jgi:hypothetical protein
MSRYLKAMPTHIITHYSSQNLLACLSQEDQLLRLQGLLCQVLKLSPSMTIRLKIGRQLKLLVKASCHCPENTMDYKLQNVLLFEWCLFREMGNLSGLLDQHKTT